MALLSGIHLQARAEIPQPKPLSAVPQSFTPLEIHQTLGVIRITANRVRIDDTLKRVHERSGIQFLMFATVRDEIVSGDFIASDWPAVIDALLRNFNHITILNDRQKPKKIIVLSVKHPPAAPNSRSREPEFSAVALERGEIGSSPSAEPDPEPESEPEPDLESKPPGDEQVPQYSTQFNFEGGIHPSDDDVQRFHDQNPPLSSEEIALAEVE
ncbi:MAG: hypothetical protein LM522_12420 [Candidatus Contendobacter sp.]|nr:hypothetical protein [Candidatus Contendobacter sp.]